MATWSQVSGNPFGPPDSEPDPFAGASAPPPIASASAPFATPPPPPTEALERPNVAPAANRGDDAFGAFEEAGLDDEAAVRELGQRFRDTVLACGGGTPPAEVFETFRGRKPSPEALIRHSGLADE